MRVGHPTAGGAARQLRPVPDRVQAAERLEPLAVLRSAAAAVADASGQPGGALHPEETRPLLEWLVAAVAAAVNGAAPERGGPAVSALGLHLLGLLQAEVVRGWRSAEAAPDQEDILDLLEAIEEVRLAILPGSPRDFASLLSGPDGLDLVVGLAHDLRSPLTSVLFLADTLGRARSGPVNDLQRRQLRLIYSAALALNSLSSDVIELARGGDRLVEKEPEAFSVAELMESLRDMVLPIAEEKGVEVRQVLPSTDRRVGRPLALSRVLLNLTTNALKFTDKGFVEITGTAKGLAGVEFSVRDTGHGISQEAMASLYEPFRRSRGRSRHGGYHHFSGTGLGLAMCRRLVEALGSKLEYETRPEWGTRFYFRLDLPPESHRI
jgi:signal transduction histidine kinase